MRERRQGEAIKEWGREESCLPKSDAIRLLNEISVPLSLVARRDVGAKSSLAGLNDDEHFHSDQSDICSAIYKTIDYGVCGLDEREKG